MPFKITHYKIIREGYKDVIKSVSDIESNPYTDYKISIVPLTIKEGSPLKGEFSIIWPIEQKKIEIQCLDEETVSNQKKIVKLQLELFELENCQVVIELATKITRALQEIFCLSDPRCITSEDSAIYIIKWDIGEFNVSRDDLDAILSIIDNMFNRSIAEVIGEIKNNYGIVD